MVDYNSAFTGVEIDNRIAGIGVSVDEHGAIGDGVTNDTDAVKAAITAAGVNGILKFTPNSTYIIDAALTPLTGQTWIGYGATIKRINKVATTFAVAITSGVANPSITVSTGTGVNFRVGQSISFYTVGWTGTTETANQETGAYIIQSIVGDVIATNGPTLANSYAIGDNVITSTRIINSAGATDITIIGFEFDGNRSSYAGTFNYWVNHVEYRSDAARCAVRNCYFHDTLAEGVIIGGSGSSVTDCQFINTGGNGVHISCNIGDYGGTIHNCYFKGNNLGASTNHQDGAVSLSANVNTWTLSDSVCEGNSQSLALIGGLDATTVNLVIDNCRVKGTVNDAIDFIGTYTADVDTVKILNTHVDNSGNINITSNTVASTVLNVTVAGCTVLQGEIRFGRVANSSILNNIVDNTGDATRQCFNLNLTQNVDLKGNKAVEGAWGIGLNSGGCTDTVVSGNTITNPQGRGISLIAAGVGSIIDNNKIIANASAGSGFTAMYSQEANGIWTNNVFSSTAVTGFVIAMDLNATADGSDVTGNTFVNPTSEGGIYVRAGNTTSNLINNVVSVATNDAGTTTNIVNESLLA